MGHHPKVLQNTTAGWAPSCQGAAALIHQFLAVGRGRKAPPAPLVRAIPVSRVGGMEGHKGGAGMPCSSLEFPVCSHSLVPAQPSWQGRPTWDISPDGPQQFHTKNKLF